jgi:hypothetical protein
MEDKDALNLTSMHLLFEPFVRRRLSHKLEKPDTNVHAACATNDIEHA